MKHTPLTDRNIFDINSIIGFIDTLSDKNAIYENGVTKIMELFDMYIDISEKIDEDEIKSEFWEIANDFKDPVRLKHIYKIKFKQLLNWTKAEKFDSPFIVSLTSELLMPYLNRHVEYGFKISFEESVKINTSFILLIASLFSYKEDVESLLEQCDAFAGRFDDNSSQMSTNIPSFKIASKRKTDVIKILSAMYECGMFVTKEGKTATNKQEMMEAFGEFLGDDLSAYSTLLTQAKDKDKSTFFKPFDEITKAIKKYYEAE